jgi:hypothetical protein
MPFGQFWPKLSWSRTKLAPGSLKFILANITGLLRALNPLRGYPFGIQKVSAISGTQPIHTLSGTTTISGQNYRPHFVGLNGHPCGAPIWVPYRAPISRFHFVNYCPFGAGMLHVGVPMGAHISLGSTSWYYFLLRAPSGPLMGTLSGTHVGTPMGYPLLKTQIMCYCCLHPAPPPYADTGHPLSWL